VHRAASALHPTVGSHPGHWCILSSTTTRRFLRADYRLLTGWLLAALQTVGVCCHCDRLCVETASQVSQQRAFFLISMEQNRKSTNKTKADPVILHRLGILRLRFRSDSIPDAAAYRQLIILFKGLPLQSLTFFVIAVSNNACTCFIRPLWSW
jgi:hypothetical protein